MLEYKLEYYYAGGDRAYSQDVELTAKDEAFARAYYRKLLDEWVENASVLGEIEPTIVARQLVEVDLS